MYSLSYEKKLNTNVLKNLFRSKKTFLNNLSRQTLQSIDFYNQMETLEALKSIQFGNEEVPHYYKIMTFGLDIDKRLVDFKFNVEISFADIIVMFGSLDLIKTFIPPGTDFHIKIVALFRGDYDIICYLIPNLNYSKTHLREMGVQENIIDKLDQKFELIENYDDEDEDWDPPNDDNDDEDDDDDEDEDDDENDDEEN